MNTIGRAAALVAGALVFPALVGNTALADITPSASPPANCHGAYDPYAYTPSALQACGVNTFRASITDLPGGGKKYTYAGSDAQTTVPPRGFDPITASAAALAEYGYPPRPAPPASDALWQQVVRIPRAAPEPFLAQRSDYSAAVTNNHWSGYAARNGGLTYVQAEYSEPTIGSGCSGASELTWAGLGGYPAGVSGALAQTGTGHNVGLSSHQPWWEIATQSSGSVTAFPQGGTTRAGDVVLAIVDTQSQPGYAGFSVSDITTGASWQTTVSLRGLSSSSSAEAILERPVFNGSPTTLSNVGTWNVIYAGAAQNNVAQNLSNFSPDAINMYNGGTQLALVGALGQGFTDTWKHCS